MVTIPEQGGGQAAKPAHHRRPVETAYNLVNNGITLNTGQDTLEDFHFHLLVSAFSQGNFTYPFCSNLLSEYGAGYLLIYQLVFTQIVHKGHGQGMDQVFQGIWFNGFGGYLPDQFFTCPVVKTAFYFDGFPYYDVRLFRWNCCLE
jgi:hypothetical protein